MAEDEQMKVSRVTFVLEFTLMCLQDATGTKTKSPEDWIRLVSHDGYSYLVRRKVAMASGTLRNMLSADSE